MADGSVVFAISADDKDAQKKLDQLRRDIERTKAKLSESSGKQSGIAAELSDARAEAKRLQDDLDRINAKRAEAAKNMSANAPARGKYSMVDPDLYFKAQEEFKALGVEQTERQAQLEQANKAVARLEAQEKKVTTQVEAQAKALSQLEEQAGAYTRNTHGLNGDGFAKMSDQIAAASKQFKLGFRNILKWVFGIRSVFFLMRKLRAAVKEGVKAFAEFDSETKANINSLKNSLNALKVAWGAAFAPIVNAVAPLLQTLISWLVRAAEAIQMFFNVLRGKNTYQKVIASNKDLAKSYGGAGKAAEDAQKQLMGFDEINKLEDKNSGGGGGGGGSSLIDGLDEETIPQDFIDKVGWLKEKFQALAEFLQPVVKWFEDHLDIIKGLLIGIGAAFLGWKLLGLIGGFKKLIGFALAFYGIVEFIEEILDAWNNGIDFGNVIDSFTFLGIAAIGLYIIFGKTGMAIGLIVGGLAMLVTGFHEVIETGQLTWETFSMIAAGLLAIAAGIALLTGSWIPLLVAAITIAVAALVKLIVDNWDKIKAFFAKVWEAIKGFFKKVWENLKTEITRYAQYVSDFLDAIFGSISSVIKSVIGIFVNLWNSVVQIFNGIITFVKGVFTGNWRQAWEGIVQIFSGLWQGIAGTAKGIVNVVIGIIESFVNGIIGGVNAALAMVSRAATFVARVFGGQTVSIQIGYVHFPRLAKGGIVDGATPFLAGEAGKEAVVPLERNTEWIGMVADGLLDSIAGNSKLAKAISEIPAIARGQIVPPRALSNGGSMFTDADIDKLINGIVAAISVEENQRPVKLYLDGRLIAETVTKEQRRMERGFA